MRAVSFDGADAQMQGRRNLCSRVAFTDQLKNLQLPVTELLDLRSFGIKSGDELPRVFATMAQERAEAVFVIAGPQLFPDRERLAALALKHRLPSMHTVSEYVDAGGLISYGPSYPDLFRRAALYVDKILKGAKPGDLPFEQPTRYSLVINLRTAKTLGLTIPPALRGQADELIQ